VKVGDLVKNRHWREQYNCPKYGLLLVVLGDAGAKVWWDRHRDSWRPDLWNQQGTLEVISERR